MLTGATCGQDDQVRDAVTTSRTTYDDAAVGARAVELDARALLGRVMGFVAVTVGFTALGAYIGRDLSGAAGLVLFIAAFGCIFGLNVAAARGREQLALGLLFALGLLLGLAVAPVIADYAEGDPSALWQAAAATAAFVGALGAYRLRRAGAESAVPIAAGIFLDILNVFLLLLNLFGDE